MSSDGGVHPVVGDELAFAAVLQLASKNKRTLGFLPDEAFRERAARGTLLAAFSEDGLILGYVLFDSTRRGIVVRHLCVDDQGRRHGVARQLVGALVERWSHTPGISLFCRRDWPATGLWPKLGFVPVGERPGRGQDGGLLTKWWRPLAARGLFDWTADVGPGLPAVADLNVILDLYDPSRDGAEQSQILTDPVCDTVELLATDKLLNELHNRSDDDRVRQRAYVEQYRHVPVDLADADRLHDVLVQRSRDLGLPDCADDLRYVAEAASAGLPVFVTRDTRARSAIGTFAREVADVEVLTPAELVLRAEELRDERAFRPAQLLDSSLKVRSAKAGDEPALIDEFLMKAKGERKARFSGSVRSLISSPKNWSSSIVFDETLGKRLAFTVSGTHDEVLEVPVLRVTPGRLTFTLARQLAFGFRETARTSAAKAVRVTDPFCADLVRVALEGEGFVAADAGFVCPVVTARGSSTEVLPAILESLSFVPGRVPEPFAPSVQWISSMSNDATAELESRLWPLKVLDAPLANFLIPIRPTWAAALFDVDLSSATLFPRPTGLAIECEHAYYRSPRPATVFAPSRILWYVSGAGRVRGAGAVRACSQLLEVEVGSTRDIYARYKHLGTYSYGDVASTAKDGNVMALRFGKTERFGSAVPLDQLREIAKDHDHNLVLQGPTRIDGEVFADVYCRGFPNG